MDENTPQPHAVGLFGGPGGWDVATEELGIRAVGIEWDHATCETRRATGFLTIEDDVRVYGPKDFPNARILIGSPPCQTFSMAGDGAGRKALDAVLALGWRMAVREDVSDTMSELGDERTGLVLEPLRWALEAADLGRPYEVIVLEQVPTVLPVWEMFAEILRAEGYSVVTGRLSAEEYGVAQTRKRAILIARLHGEARLPEPTHRRYRKGVAQDEGDPALLPWMSMAEALGWDADRWAQRSNYSAGSSDGSTAKERGRTHRGMDTPSVTITSKGFQWVYRGSNQAHAAVRDLDEPAPTVNFAARSNKVEWMPNRAIARDPKASGIRVLPEEAAILQSFPANHGWRGTKSQILQQIGNAVPPTLAAAILKCAIDVKAEVITSAA